MKVLITGGTGFIGSHLVQACIDNPDFKEIRTLGRRFPNTKLPYHTKLTKHHSTDLINQFEVEKLFTQYKPDIIYHLAANPIPKLDEENPTRIICDNVIATQNLLHFCPAGCRFLFASSITVYGDWINNFSQYAYNEDSVCIPNSVYGLTKFTSEHLMHIYRDKRGLKTCALRLCAVGGGESTHGIIPDLVNNCLTDPSISLPVLGNRPGSAKPYLHIDDCIQAFKVMTDVVSTFKLAPEVINVGPNDNINCEQIANLVLEYFGKGRKNQIKWRGEEANWHGDNKLLQFDCNLLTEFGWNPKYPTSALAVEQTVKEKYEQFVKERASCNLSSVR